MERVRIVTPRDGYTPANPDNNDNTNLNPNPPPRRHIGFVEQSDPRASFVSDYYSRPDTPDVAPSETSSPYEPHGGYAPTPEYGPGYAAGHEPQYSQKPSPIIVKPRGTGAGGSLSPTESELDIGGMSRRLGATGLKHSRTTINRRVKTVKLSSSGNFVIKQRVPDEALQNANFNKGEEFESMRYTAATCDPDHFIERNYNLRLTNYRRHIEIFVVVTMYNEDQDNFNRTMFGLAQNIKYLCEKGKYGWDADGWQKVAVCIVSDGRSKIHPNVLKVLEVMGVYQEGLAQASVNDEPTAAHIFEYTAQTFVDPKHQPWGAREGMPPMQTIFCLKEKNAKKINSHRWFFKAFSSLIEPRVCVLIDVGTRPKEDSLYALWKAFFRNEQIAGACGEIRADLGSGLQYFKSIMNPLVASQNFEYKISNLLDKSLESAFGYISVLPGAFSAYRWKALQDTGPGEGPLAKYFEGEQREGKPQDSSIFSANLYLAEDRILCFELVAKKNANWTLHYVSRAAADTDVPDSVPEFLSQRRRWLNGSLFAGFYALANIGRIWQSRHSFGRKIAFTIQYMYNIVNQIFSWFILGNFAVTFYYLFAELQSILEDPSVKPGETASKLINVLINIARFSYPVALICLFIISFGNRPQAFRRTYTVVMFGFGVIGAVMIGLLVRRCLTLAHTQLSGLDQAYANLFRPLLAQTSSETTDGGQLLVNALLMQVANVTKTNVDANLKQSKHEALIYMVTLASTFGVYFFASFIQFDFMHMFTCFIQYLLLLPSYINVLTVYALSNLHDVSWGTKGDSKAEVLPSVLAKKEKDGTVVADVSVAADRHDLSVHYKEALSDLQRLSHSPKEPPPPPDAKQKQEDDYKSFRTTMMLTYLGTNALLFALATQLSVNAYLLVLLCAVAGISAMKLMGVLAYLFMKFLAEVGHCCDGRSDRGRWKKQNKGWTPRRAGSRSPPPRGRAKDESELAMLERGAPMSSKESVYSSGSTATFVSMG
ncbi:Chitin synthase, class 1 [Borealophlyctis nickersoniae]|nr:Chitin synthase, class 1 [Borealophlyctis nickersoniae]